MEEIIKAIQSAKRGIEVIRVKITLQLANSIPIPVDPKDFSIN